MNYVFRRFMNKRKLKGKLIELSINQEIRQITISELVHIVDEKGGREKAFINQTIVKIELFESDIEEFILFLAKSYFKESKNF